MVRIKAPALEQTETVSQAEYDRVVKEAMDYAKLYGHLSAKLTNAEARIRELEDSRGPEFRYIRALESAQRIYENERAQRPPLMAKTVDLVPLPPCDLAVTITDTTNAEVTAPTKPAGAAEAITISPSA